MRWLHDRYTFASRERWALGALGAGLFLLAVLAYWPALAAYLPTLCPTRRLGGYCPGCGLTRACCCLLRADFATALRYNPLVYVAAPFVAYKALELLVGAASGRVLASGWPRRFVVAYQVAFVALVLILAVIRTATWLYPDCNPGGFALPPEP